MMFSRGIVTRVGCDSVGSDAVGESPHATTVRMKPAQAARERGFTNWIRMGQLRVGFRAYSCAPEPVIPKGSSQYVV
jgi:hypothetical protein